jgi:hypothetical protein
MKNIAIIPLTLLVVLVLGSLGCEVVDESAETAGEALEGVGEVVGDAGRTVERELAN